jgi:sec-independent protein translocase protein TatA
MFSSNLLIFDIGGGELMLIIFVALLLFGGEKLPQLARGLGKGIRDFKDASEGVKREIANQIDNYEKKPDPVVTPEVVATPESETTVKPESLAVSPVANTIPAGESHTATDNLEMTPDHFMNEKTGEGANNHTGALHTSSDPIKEQHS